MKKLKKVSHPMTMILKNAAMSQFLNVSMSNHVWCLNVKLRAAWKSVPNMRWETTTKLQLKRSSHCDERKRH